MFLQAETTVRRCEVLNSRTVWLQCYGFRQVYRIALVAAMLVYSPPHHHSWQIRWGLVLQSCAIVQGTRSFEVGALHSPNYCLSAACTQSQGTDRAIIHCLSCLGFIEWHSGYMSLSAHLQNCVRALAASALGISIILWEFADSTWPEWNCGFNQSWLHADIAY